MKKHIFFGKHYSIEQFGSFADTFDVQAQDLVATIFVDFLLDHASCYVFSSEKAVLALQHSKQTLPLGAHILVVGCKSKTRLEKMGYCIKHMESSARELAEWMLRFLPAQKIIHLCSDKALDIFSEKLGEGEGWKYSQKIVYKTKELCPLLEQKFDALVFFSPSGVRSFLQKNTLEVAAIFSLGESTSQEIEKHVSGARIFTSQKNTFSDILHLIERKQRYF